MQISPLVFISIPELHKALREYEAINPLPTIPDPEEKSKQIARAITGLCREEIDNSFKSLQGAFSGAPPDSASSPRQFTVTLVDGRKETVTGTGPIFTGSKLVFQSFPDGSPEVFFKLSAVSQVTEDEPTIPNLVERALIPRREEQPADPWLKYRPEVLGRYFGVLRARFKLLLEPSLHPLVDKLFADIKRPLGSDCGQIKEPTGDGLSGINNPEDSRIIEAHLQRMIFTESETKAASIGATAVPGEATPDPRPSASIRGSSSLATPDSPPPIHAGLIFPHDREYLSFLGKYLAEAIRALGENDVSPEICKERFEELRRLAKKYKRTDRELIESIIVFRRLPNFHAQKLIAAVSDSLRAAWTAEAVTANQKAITDARTALEAHNAASVADATPPSLAASSLKAIEFNLNAHGSESITPELKAHLLGIISRANQP